MIKKLKRLFHVLRYMRIKKTSHGTVGVSEGQTIFLFPNKIYKRHIRESKFKILYTTFRNL
jgi:hypothetical protein